METSPSSRVFPLGGCRRARDVCDRRSWSQCCHFVRDQILPWAFGLALFYLRRPNSGLHEGTGTLLYFLVNHVLTNHVGKKLHKNREIAIGRAVGVWMHRDC